MAETKPKQSPSLRQPKAKKKLGLSVPPALRLPHDDLIFKEQIPPAQTVQTDSTTIEPPAIAVSSTLEPFYPAASHGARVEPPAIARDAIAPDAFTRIPNGILDRVLPTLSPYDQLVLLRLYRLSRGFGKEECTVGYESIAKACNMSSRQAQISTERLILAGWVERVGVKQGGKSRQSRGSVYRVNLPGATTKASGAISDTIAERAIAAASTNKYKDIKENIKRGSRSRDFSECPDCEGRGFWWPEGFERGVAKCKHKRLTG